MNRLTRATVGAVGVMALSIGAAWASGPEVTNVQAAQRPDDSKLIDITFDLTDDDGDLCSVWVRVSDDGGASWTIPAQTFIGDVGPNVQPGTGKSITWDAGADIPGKSGDIKVRVYADDGNGMANMVFVPPDSGMPPLHGFWIDKYEVTNLRYCEFLNAGGNDDHWDDRMEIIRSGSGNPSYTYAPEMGYQSYPVRYVSGTDAWAFATWLSIRTNRNYRIPTNEEWVKAAAWDPVEQHAYLYGFHSDTLVGCSPCNYQNCVSMTTPVGSYPGSSYYGCFDMSGNVWELTSAGNNRGGSWGSGASACQTSDVGGAFGADMWGGFRLVLDLE